MGPLAYGVDDMGVVGWVACQTHILDTRRGTGGVLRGGLRVLQGLVQAGRGHIGHVEHVQLAHPPRHQPNFGCVLGHMGPVMRLALSLVHYR